LSQDIPDACRKTLWTGQRPLTRGKSPLPEISEHGGGSDVLQFRSLRV